MSEEYGEVVSEAQADDSGKALRAESSFKYDHKVYTADGTFDPVASEKKEQAYLDRREARIAAKGKPHLCKAILGDNVPLHTRQLRRLAARRLAKQEARQNGPCHPPRQPKLNSPRWKRQMRKMMKAGLLPTTV